MSLHVAVSSHHVTIDDADDSRWDDSPSNKSRIPGENASETLQCAQCVPRHTWKTA